MPSLFFDLLFIGFPLGALAGVYLFVVSRPSFLKTLWILQGTMLFSILAMLACKHFDYLRAHLFDVELQRLFLQMLIFTLFFLPFFIAYGLSEYIGYQIGRRHLRGRMPMVYAIYLFGAAGAYLFAEFMFPLLGATRLLGIPFLLVTLAMLLLGTGQQVRRGLIVLQATIVALIFIPQLEGGFLKLYKGASPQSTHAYANMGFETIHQQWGKYSLIEIMQAPGMEGYVGFYNDIIQWRFAPATGFFAHSMGMLPLELAPAGGHIAIIGAGAGRFDHVYEDNRVQLVIQEARSYMEDTDRRFDLIYLPSVGGYPQMMLEPGNMIRTSEAYKTLSERLTAQGILAIWYPAVLEVRAYRNRGEFLILAAKRAEYLPTLEQARDFYLRPAVAQYGENFASFFVDPTVQVEKTWDSSVFKPIRDNQPFLAGNVQHIFSLQQVGILFALVLGLLLGFAALLFLLLRRRGNPAIPGRSFPQLVLISLFVGANFLIIEHYLILTLFQKLYIYRDALVLGAISFLLITGLGSTFIKPSMRPLFQLIGGLFILLLLLLQDSLSPWANLALIAPVAFVTGSFFPALFEAAAENPLGVFAADAIGAAIGSMASFFIPIVFGFNWFFVFATVIFWGTALVTFLFFRNLKTVAAD
jgi:hypothetical protein